MVPARGLKSRSYLGRAGPQAPASGLVPAWAHVQALHGIGSPPARRFPFFRPSGFGRSCGLPRIARGPPARAGREAVDRFNWRPPAMVERTGYIDGEPCWADVVAADVPAAPHFYASRFGGGYSDTRAELGNYVMCLKTGRIVGGMSPPMPGSEQLPAAWSLYLMSHDLAATAHRIEEHG